MNAHLIIDGHNLLHKIPDLAELHRHQPESARQKLIDLLANFAAQAPETVHLVFDGRGPKAAQMAHDASGELRIVYSGKGMSADTLIERVTARHAKNQRMTVVSDDRLVRDSAQANEAFTMNCQSFLQRLDDSVRNQRRYFRKD